MDSSYSISDLNKYFSGGKKHIAYEETVKLYKALRLHIDGEVPKDILEITRPNQPEEVKTYVKAVYKPKTKGILSKVFNSLSKIPRADGWSIQFIDENVPSKVTESESPNEYFTENFPYTDSLEKWLFNVYQPTYAADANAIILVMPLKTDIEDNDYLKPFPFIFTSDRIYEDGVATGYMVLLSEEKSTIDINSTMQDGKIFYVVDDMNIEKYTQISLDKYNVIVYPHNLGFIPAFKIPGVFKKQKNKTIINESRLSPMLCDLDCAIMASIDFDAARILHLFPERWEYRSQKCMKCNGTGFSISPADGTKLRCNENGCDAGYIGGNPFKTFVINAGDVKTNMGDGQIPTPPFGYGVKDIKTLDAQYKLMQDYCYNALAAINMEFLAQVPLANTSAEGKSLDRDETNNFAYAWANDIKWTYIKICYISICYRYASSSLEEKKGMVPKVTIPVNYNMVSSTALVDEFSKAKDAAISPVILKILQSEYVTKKFQNDDDSRNLLVAVAQLNPLFAMNMDDRVLALAQGGITETDFIISCYDETFVTRAVAQMEQNGGKEEDFYDLDFDKQKAMLVVYANEVIEANSAKAKLMASFQQAAPPANP